MPKGASECVAKALSAVPCFNDRTHNPSLRPPCLRVGLSQDGQGSVPERDARMRQLAHLIVTKNAVKLQVNVDGIGL
jgi:hypothetical protein